MLFNLRQLLCFAAVLVFAVSSSAAAAALPSQKAHEMSLPEIARHVMAIYFGDEKAPPGGLDQFSEEVVTKQHFLKSGGVFVTLYKNGKTRACWGSVLPQAKTIAKSTIYATMGALTKEYRYKPISQSEYKTLKTQVTVIKAVEPIQSISFQNPLRDGLLVRAGGRAGVLLPGEASDAHYQLVQCKLKAGIKPGEPCQLYRLRTEIYE